MKSIVVVLASVMWMGCGGSGPAGNHEDDATGAAGTLGSDAMSAAGTGSGGTGPAPICEEWPECGTGADVDGQTFTSPTCSGRLCGKCIAGPFSGALSKRCRIGNTYCGVARPGGYVDCGCVEVTVNSQASFQYRDCSTGADADSP